jgi:hypothetical protein
MSPGASGLLDLLESRAFVDRHVIGLVALDDVLRFLRGGMPLDIP